MKKTKKKKIKVAPKPVVRRSLSTKKILTMIIDWHSVTNKYDGDYKEWWKKYPSHSLNDVIEEAKKKVNCA